MSASAVGDVLAAVAAVMRETGTRWYVFGAQAASHWGRPRMTADVDVTAMISAERIDEFISTMKAHDFALRVDDRAFVERTGVLPFIHTPSSYPVDVVMAGPGLEEEFLRRAVHVEIHQTHLPVISAEDLVIAKILAGRAKDIEDVRGIVRERADTLDLGRIREVLELLEQALTRSDLLPVFENELKRARE